MKQHFVITPFDTILLVLPNGIPVKPHTETSSAILRNVSFDEVNLPHRKLTIGCFETEGSFLDFKPSADTPIVQVNEPKHVTLASGITGDRLNGLGGMKTNYMVMCPSHPQIVFGESVDFCARTPEEHAKFYGEDEGPDDFLAILESIFGVGNVKEVTDLITGKAEQDEPEQGAEPEVQVLEELATPTVEAPELFSGIYVGKTAGGDCILSTSEGDNLYLLRQGSTRVTPITY